MKVCKIVENVNGMDVEYLGYRDEILGELIEEAKYESVRGLIPEIAGIVYHGYFEGISDEEIFLVPMPTSRQHVRERAMDHMDMIAREIERLSCGKVRRARLLVRAKDTVQMGASETVRKRQAKEAVKMNQKYLTKKGEIISGYRGERVILVDDVWTTGASLTEAGKMLKKAGVNNLTLLAITKSRARKSPALRHGEIY
jgi:competence protein ComFC